MECRYCKYKSKKFFEICPECKKNQKDNLIKDKKDSQDDTIVLLKKQIDDIQQLLIEDENSNRSKEDKVLNKVDNILEGTSKKDDLTDTKEYDLNLEKTISITSIEDTKEYFGLLDDINKQIDDINENASTNDREVKKIEKEIADSELIVSNEIEKDINKEKSNIDEVQEKNEEVIVQRKTVFVMTGIAILILLFSVLLILFFASSDNEQAKVEYVDKMNVAMQTYYDTSDIDDIIYILEEAKNDEKVLLDLQVKVRTVCNSWVLLYLNEEVENKEKFEEATTKYRELIEGLYRYAIVKTDDNLIRALTEKDYDELMVQFNNIYNDSAIFYEALELYNAKDYNKAYYMFSRVEDSNSYYEKSVTYLSIIEEDIINMIKKDISKLEKNIDTLEDSEKLKIYTSIEQIIISYNNLYVSVSLNEKNSYQELLSLYTSKVSDYTDKVINGNVN